MAGERKTVSHLMILSSAITEYSEYLIWELQTWKKNDPTEKCFYQGRMPNKYYDDI
jgi:hypothetical protein